MYLNKADTGGAFVFENECTVTIDNSRFNDNSATSNGGIMTITDSDSGILTNKVITIKNCDEFNGATADYGALFYVNNPSVSLLIQNVTMVGIEATTSGAIAYITRA